MKASAVLRGLVPGIAQIHRGRSARGLLLFLLFALSLNGYLIYPLVDDNAGLRTLCLALTVLFWFISFVDALANAPKDAPAPEPAPHDGA